MNRVFASVAMALCAIPAVSAQKLEILEGFRPFRNPSMDVEVPRQLFDDLQVLVNVIENPEGHPITIDDQGREVCAHPTWQRVRDRVVGNLFNMATVFGRVLRDSGNVNDRKLAAYGAFLLDDPQHVCQLIAFLPGEPERGIREPAFGRAIHFLKVHLPKSITVLDGDDYVGVPPPLYRLDAGPFLAMLELDDFRDQAQALWFLKELMLMRPEAGPTFLHYAKDPLRSFMVSEHRSVREQAREFLYRADPEHRDQPAADADDEALIAWLDEVLYELFPPIRIVSPGLVDLYPSEDLDLVISKGRDVLQREAIGEPDSGKLPNGLFYRGFRIATLPQPLDKLGLPIGAVVTSVHGQPVATGAQILAALETWLANSRSVMVEYVQGGQTKAIEYRLIDE